MAIPYFKDRFTFHMQDILASVWNVADLQTLLQDKQAQISPAALADDYKGLDYGFSDQDFLNALQLTWGAHVKSGIVPYLQNRKTSALGQLTAYQNLPNPCLNNLTELELQATGKIINVTDVLGRSIPAETKNCIKILIYENGAQKRIYEME
jgi:hypothetical protein